ncbi:uncharacterized protein [Argopecten irradians]|uniref:uncharacterized protein n=1 Tax=Argopecten irradians TaxID=31199 RepID=UPI0037129C14
MASLTWSVFVLVTIVSHVRGHGYMTDPPSRSIASDNPSYRYDTPQGLNCGGRWKQTQNNDKCGPCGDDYSQSQPRDNEEDGKYYDPSYIRPKYASGDTIPVAVKITAHHKGFFDFKLCASADKTRRTTQLEDCLAEHPLEIVDDVTNTRGLTWDLTSDRKGTIQLKVVLPAGVSCDHCVLRWRWVAGNNAGKNAKQEEFRNCMDIEIEGNGNVTPAPWSPGPTPAPTQAYTQAPMVTSCPNNYVLSCTSVAPLPDIDCVNSWCTSQCSAHSSECTSARCKCTCDWKVRQCSFVNSRYAGLIANPDSWCKDMCDGGACSKAHCSCNYY